MNKHFKYRPILKIQLDILVSYIYFGIELNSSASLNKNHISFIHTINQTDTMYSNID